LYYFKINRDRTRIELGNAQRSSGLTDLVVDNNQELSEVIFGTGFDSVSDIKIGPDGLLYVLSFGDGKIYAIGPVQAR
jgi:hypothetical protein